MYINIVINMVRQFKKKVMGGIRHPNLTPPRNYTTAYWWVAKTIT